MTAANPLADPRLTALDGFRVEIDPARARGDIVLNRPPLNVIEMPQRDQLRGAFEALDEDPQIRIIVLRAVGEHFFLAAAISAAFCRHRPRRYQGSRGTLQRPRAVANR